MLRSARILSVLLLLAILIGPVPASAATPFGSLRVVDTEPTSLDPAVASFVNEARVINQIYERLIHVNDEQEISPALASSWTVSPDSTVFTFTLAQAYFANGRRVMAADVLYSMMRALSPTIDNGHASYNAVFLYDIKGAEAYNGGDTTTPVGIEQLDPATVRITLEEGVPAGPFLKKLSNGVASIVAQEEVAAGGTQWWRDPARRAGTGPFTLADWTPGQSIHLTRNTHYDRAAVNLQGVVYRFFPDAPAALAAYQAGEIDVLSVTGAINGEVSGNPTLKAQLHTAAGTCYSYWSLHNQKAPFAGAAGMKLRQAINYAVDKAVFVQTSLGGHGMPARGVVPPSIYGYNPNLLGLDFNVSLAKQRLAESGYAGDPPIVLWGGTSDYTKWRAQWLAGQIATNLGIQATVTTDPSADFQMGFYGWCADYSDLDNFVPPLLQTGSPYNRTRYSNPEFDRLMDEAAGTFDEPRRVALYQQGEQLAISEAAQLPMYFDEFAVLIKPGVQGPMALRWQWAGAFTGISMGYRSVYLPLLRR